ncbi:MAG: GNAT family N-acetyltransferase [Candidatus Delongbacteria bacterium]|nr:GNAT family N-acetyltransferase [Candidatus Delongbacteria bacterium]MBN2833716.1 GNAT family N-acetyltransferase [Candidatus Delongbacteria bacterium]
MEKGFSYSKLRDVPINRNYYYLVIFSKIFNNQICSCSNDVYMICSDLFDGTSSSINEIFSVVQSIDNQFKLRRMDRYSTENIFEDININATRFTKEIIEKIEFDDLVKKNEFIKRNRDVIENGCRYVVLEKKKIVSSAFISDFIANGCNIVVNTNEFNRKNGYGKDVVSVCVSWCLENSLVPVYLVDERNETSVRLAKLVGLIIQNQEIVISKRE